MGEILGVAFGAIRTNLLRSFLTTLGIVIGVGAVITMVALGEGAQRVVEERIQRMGTNILTIRPGQQFWGGVAQGDEPLSADDAEAVRDQGSGLLVVAPEITARLQVEYLRWNSNNEIIGTWPAYFEVYDHSLQAGRIFDEGEVQGRRRVAVVGAQVPEALGTPPAMLVGKTIRIRGMPFTVIGVLAEKGEMGWLHPDEQIFIPLSTAQFRVFGGRDRLRSIYAQVPDPSQMDRAFAEIDRALRRQHRMRPGQEADFNIRNATDLLATFQETSRTFTFLLAGIAAVSLLVGGIGIMNIMLVSVTERTREIGIRKALGATRRNILLQFLVEALTLCMLGGIVGIAAGAGGAWLLTRLAEWNTAIAPEAVLLAFAFSAATGLFFGIWPAQRAAKLDPIVALRYE
ncbi:MAG: ABC transporter permease [Gemmatimonadetes bacterium]|nr:ABC transporter permease [Gemmatimonadota bacterium]